MRTVINMEDGCLRNACEGRVPVKAETVIGVSVTGQACYSIFIDKYHIYTLGIYAEMYIVFCYGNKVCR